MTFSNLSQFCNCFWSVTVLGRLNKKKHISWTRPITISKPNRSGCKLVWRQSGSVLTGQFMIQSVHLTSLVSMIRLSDFQRGQLWTVSDLTKAIEWVSHFPMSSFSFTLNYGMDDLGYNQLKMTHEWDPMNYPAKLAGQPSEKNECKIQRQQKNRTINWQQNYEHSTMCSRTIEILWERG